MILQTETGELDGRESWCVGAAPTWRLSEEPRKGGSARADFRPGPVCWLAEQLPDQEIPGSVLHPQHTPAEWRTGSLLLPRWARRSQRLRCTSSCSALGWHLLLPQLEQAPPWRDALSVPVGRSRRHVVGGLVTSGSQLRLSPPRSVSHCLVGWTRLLCCVPPPCP